MAANARDGARMTARVVETAGEGGGNGEGLRGSPMNAPTWGVLGGIMAWQRVNARFAGQKECLLILRSAIYSSERPTIDAMLPATSGWNAGNHNARYSSLSLRPDLNLPDEASGSILLWQIWRNTALTKARVVSRGISQREAK